MKIDVNSAKFSQSFNSIFDFKKYLENPLICLFSVKICSDAIFMNSEATQRILNSLAGKYSDHFPSENNRKNAICSNLAMSRDPC